MNEPNPTPEQLRAILTIDAPVCIRAGAGCGKTGVLAFHYVALLLLKGLKPSEVVTVTFTEKAAGELKDRIQKYLRQGMEGRLPFQDKVLLKSEEIALLLEDIPQAPISTLHGLAGKIVRDVSLLTGFDPHFEILDENEAHALKYEALRESLARFLEEGSPPLKHLIGIYGWQNLNSQIHEMLEDWPRWSQPSLRLSEEATEEEKRSWESLHQIFSEVLGGYEALKRGRQALDFDDLEEEALKLLQQFPLVVRHYRKLWKAYLIDEFQDTNESQDRLMMTLLGLKSSDRSDLPERSDPSELRGHLAIVGDEKQSIYAFRGAEPHIFEKLQGLIEKNGGATVTLSQNFRSPPLILGWVNSLFTQVFPNYPPLISDRQDPPGASLEALSPSLLQVNESDGSDLSDSSDRQKKKKLSAEQRRNLEASLIADRVARWLQEGVKAQEIFLLFRSLSSVSIYLKAFRELKIPVYVKSSESLLDRQEILDLIHAMKAVAEPENPLSWVGLLRSPAVGWSDERLLEEALLNPEVDWKTLSPLTQSLAQKDKQEGPFDFLNRFLEDTDLIALYGAEESQSLKSQNILQFLEFAYQWQLHHAGGLVEFVKEIDLLKENRIHLNSLSDKLGLGEAVTLMTIHQAKGLDFPIVILPDLAAKGGNDRVPIADQFKGTLGLRLPEESEGLKREFDDSEALKKIREEKKKLSLEEEDRILYVATTRAKEKMLLGFAPEEDSSQRAPSLGLLADSLKQNPKVQWITKGPQASAVSLAAPASETAPTEIRRRKRFSHFAVTQLECFLRSRDEYRERYVYRIPPQDFSKGKMGAGSQEISNDEFRMTDEKNHPSSFVLRPSSFSLDPLQRGNLIHETLCLISQSVGERDLKKTLSAVWDRHLLPKDHAAFASIAETLERTLSHSNFHSILEASEGHSEIPFLLSLGPYEIRGAMDRLIRFQEDWKVVDYKTHKVNIGATGRSPVGKIAREFEFQMKTYCLAAGRMVGKPVRKAMVYFVEPNLTHDFEFSEKELSAHEERLKELMEEINREMNDISPFEKGG